MENSTSGVEENRSEALVIAPTKRELMESIDNVINLLEFVVKSPPPRPNYAITEEHSAAERLFARTMGRMNEIFKENECEQKDTAMEADIGGLEEVAPVLSVEDLERIAENELHETMYEQRGIDESQDKAAFEETFSDEQTALQEIEMAERSAAFESEKQRWSTLNVEEKEKDAMEKATNVLTARMFWSTAEALVHALYSDLSVSDRIYTYSYVDAAQYYLGPKFPIGLVSPAILDLTNNVKRPMGGFFTGSTIKVDDDGDPMEYKHLSVCESLWYDRFIGAQSEFNVSKYEWGISLPKDRATILQMKQQLIESKFVAAASVPSVSPVKPYSPKDTLRFANLLKSAENVVRSAHRFETAIITEIDLADLSTNQEQLVAIELLARPFYRGLKHEWRRNILLLANLKRMLGVAVDTRNDIIRRSINHLAILQNVICELENGVVELSNRNDINTNHCVLEWAEDL